jgi:hypothetical protein
MGQVPIHTRNVYKQVQKYQQTHDGTIHMKREKAKSPSNDTNFSSFP